MVALYIIGIILAVLSALILLILLLKVKLFFEFSTESGFKFKVGVLFFTFGGKDKPKKEKEEDKEEEKKEKKPSKLLERIKKLFGIDVLSDKDALKENVEEGGVSEAVNRIVTVISLIAGQIFWLLKKFKIKKLKFFIICGGSDAADTAMEYGLVCAAVYPLVGYLDTNLKTAKNAQDIQIYCDFDGDSKFEFEFNVSIRIIHVVRAIFRNAMANAERLKNEEANNERNRK